MQKVIKTKYERILQLCNQTVKYWSIIPITANHLRHK